MTKAEIKELIDDEITTNGTGQITGAILNDVLNEVVDGITKDNVDLGNADNTSDANKPISTAAQAAIDLKAPIASPTFTGTPAAPTAPAGNNTTRLATTAFVQTAVSDATTGLWDDRGNYDASSNLFPATGGSGTAGAVLKGDIYTISVAGTLGGVPVAARQTVRALVDTPGQTAGNWAIGLANTDIDDSITNGVTGRAPSQNAVFDALALKEDAANKNAVSGYAGLNAGYALQLKNAAGTFTSILGNANTAARTYGLQDRDGTLADDTDISNLQTQITALVPDFASFAVNTPEAPGKTDYIGDATGGNIQLTMLTNVVGGARRRKIIKGDASGNTVTVRLGGTDVFPDGSNSVVLAAQNDWVEVAFNGSGLTAIAYSNL